MAIVALVAAVPCMAQATASLPSWTASVDAALGRALWSHGIAVTAVHSHMLTEEPRLFFMHFWANDNAVTLAQGLRAALDATTARR